MVSNNNKKKIEYGLKERRREKLNHIDEKRVESEKVRLIVALNDERYQFENLIIYYKARFNVWQVIDTRKHSWEQILFECVGYASSADAFIWAKNYIMRNKNKP